MISAPASSGWNFNVLSCVAMVTNKICNRRNEWGWLAGWSICLLKLLTETPFVAPMGTAIELLWSIIFPVLWSHCLSTHEDPSWFSWPAPSIYCDLLSICTTYCHMFFIVLGGLNIRSKPSAYEPIFGLCCCLFPSLLSLCPQIAFLDSIASASLLTKIPHKQLHSWGQVRMCNIYIILSSMLRFH